MEFTTAELAPIAEQLAKLCQQKLEEDENRAIVKLEEGLRAGMQRLGGMVLSNTLSQADSETRKAMTCECGGKLKYQRKREARLKSVFGWVEYKRSYYADCRCGKGLAPLDKEMGLEPGKITPGLARLLGMTGASMAFEEGSKWIEEFLLLGTSENSIRTETQGLGQYQEEAESRWKEQSQDLAYLQARERSQSKPPKRIYGSLDGAHVRIEDPNENEKWREVKVGCWYQVEPVPTSRRTRRHQHKAAIGQQALRAKDQQYYCDIQTVSEFEALFWATGCRAQADLTEELIFVADGAQWIWQLVATHFPQAVQIVDWFHAEERLEKVAQEAFPSGPQRDAWLEEARSSLWWGHTSFVIRACHALAPVSQQAAAAATYFQNNADRMQYDRFREQGYMIGSGTIESACKQIVAHRLRCSGAQWTVEGARLTAKARAAWLSHNHDWTNLCSRRAGLPLAA